MQEFDNLCSSERQRIRMLPLNDQYSQTIVYNDRVYRYDPDYDCFYAVANEEELTHWARYNWIYVTIVLAVIVYFTAP